MTQDVAISESGRRATIGSGSAPSAASTSLRRFLEEEDEGEPVHEGEQWALEVAFLWAETRLQVEHVWRRRRLGIGEGRNVDFFLASEALPSPEFPLVSREGAGYRLNLTSEREGAVRAGGAVYALSDVAGEGGSPANRSAGASFGLDLTPEMRVALKVGGVTILVKAVSAPPRLGPSWVNDIHYGFLNTFLASFFLHAALLIAAIHQPYDAQRLPAPSEPEDRLSRAVVAASSPPAPPVRPEPDERADAEPTPNASSDAGEAPREEREVVADRFDAYDEEAIAAVFEGASLGEELEEALGEMAGDARVGAEGAEELAVAKGEERPSSRERPLKADPIGTRGRAGGAASYGAGVPDLGDRRQAELALSEGEPEVRGALDRALIRRVIHANRAQIRYCYERQLQMEPGLEGRVTLRFVIGGDGGVREARIERSGLENAAVERCLVERLQRWRFPEPRGGGVVVVTYPFVFRQAR